MSANNKFNLSCILILITIVFSQDIFADKNVNISVESIYSEICSGQIDKAKTDIQKILPSDMAYIPSRLYYLLLKEGQHELTLLLSKADSDLESLDQADRVLMAESLLMSRSTDLSKIKKILAFSSNDETVENYRKYTDGLVDIRLGQTENGLAKMKESIDKLSFVDPAMLLNFFGETLSTAQPKSILKKYIPLIEQISKASPTKYDLLAFIDLINSDKYNSGLLSNYAKKSYEICPSDPSMALGYAITLYQAGEIDHSKNILLDLATKSMHYSPLVDMYLSLVFLNKADQINMKIYLDKAKKSLVYFHDRDKEIIGELDLKLNALSNNKIDNDNFFTGYNLFYLLLFVPVVWLVLKIRIGKNV